jgi:HipA-like protein
LFLWQSVFIRFQVASMRQVISTEKHLGQLLLGLRKSQGLTQAQLAQQAGISQARLSVLELNPGRITVERLMRLMARFRSLSLSMPAIRSNRTIKGAVVNSYFDNLLPDSDVIRKPRLQAKFRAKDVDAFALLSGVGRDCVGAIHLLARGAAPEGVESIDAVPLDEQGVERLIRHALAAPSALVPEDEDDLPLSIAGAQEKTVLLWHDGHWCKPLRATPTTHILKLPLGLVGNRRADMTTSVDQSRDGQSGRHSRAGQTIRRTLSVTASPNALSACRK